jgi:Iron-containing redox enzyme
VTTAQGLDAPQSALLRRKIEVLLPTLLAAGRRLAAHPQVAELYPEYLIQMHGIVRASVPLMEAARAQALLGAEDDPVLAGLAEYLGEHIGEEADHDEWLLADLEYLGRRRADVLARPPSTTIAALVGAQYYWMFHYHPVALLGYIALLEGYPPVPEDVSELVERTGYGQEAFRTLTAHAELDPHHSEELDHALDALQLTHGQSEVLGLSALYTVHMTTRMLDEVVEGTVGRP